MAAAAQGAVEVDAAVHGVQQADGLIEQDRDVLHG